MKIVLKEDIFKLGKEGDEVEVRDGFARNHLLPKGLAVFANKHNLEIFRQKKRSILKKQETKKQLANELKIKLDSVKLEFFMKSNDNGKLFHSVNNLNIAEELAKMGFELERKKIEVPHGSLKSFGTYDVNIKLYEGISSLIKVEIKEELEKSMQKKEKKTEKA